MEGLLTSVEFRPASLIDPQPVTSPAGPHPLVLSSRLNPQAPLVLVMLMSADTQVSAPQVDEGSASSSARSQVLDGPGFWSYRYTFMSTQIRYEACYYSLDPFVLLYHVLVLGPDRVLDPVHERGS